MRRPQRNRRRGHEPPFLRPLGPAFFGPFRDLPPQPAAPQAPWPGDLDARPPEGSEFTFRCPRPDIGCLAPRQKPAIQTRLAVSGLLRLLAEFGTHKLLPAQPNICSDSEGVQSLVCLHLLPASRWPRARSIMAQKHALAPCTCFCAFHSAVCCSSVLCVKINHGLGP